MMLPNIMMVQPPSTASATTNSTLMIRAGTPAP